MPFDTKYVSGRVAAMRGVLVCATVEMRQGELTYSGSGGTIEQRRETDENGQIWITEGYVRLIISELPERLPKSGDKVQVKGADGNDWITRILTIVRKDEAKATLYCGYGERYD